MPLRVAAADGMTPPDVADWGKACHGSARKAVYPLGLWRDCREPPAMWSGRDQAMFMCFTGLLSDACDMLTGWVFSLPSFDHGVC
jgi:hypothetical protein